MCVFFCAQVAGQDYRVQTHAFPEGLLEGKGISLGHSAQSENDALMRAIQEGRGQGADAAGGGAAVAAQATGLPVLREGAVELSGADAGRGGADGAPRPTMSAEDEWDDSASGTGSMGTGSELSLTISDSASGLSGRTNSSQVRETSTPQSP